MERTGTTPEGCLDSPTAPVVSLAMKSAQLSFPPLPEHLFDGQLQEEEKEESQKDYYYYTPPPPSLSLLLVQDQQYTNTGDNKRF